jgi:hypothetical protein
MLEFILATVGLTFIITYYYIFNWLRNYLQNHFPNTFGKLIKCPACMGFWIGMFVKLLLLIHYGLPLSLIIIFIYGCIGSISSYLIYVIFKPLMDTYG